MGALIHLVKKESLVLVRDWHALLLLFAMPVLFILVMSLALRDRFAAQQGALTYYLPGCRTANSDRARGHRIRRAAQATGGVR